VRVVLAILVLTASLAGCIAQPNNANPAVRDIEVNRLMKEVIHSEAYIVAEYGGEVILRARSGLDVLLKIPPNALLESGTVNLTEMEPLPGNAVEGLISAFAIGLPGEKIGTELSVKIVAPAGESGLGRVVAPMAIVPMQNDKQQAFSRTTLLPYENKVEVRGEIATEGVFLLVEGAAVVKTWPPVIQVGVGEAWPLIVVGGGEMLRTNKSRRLRFQSSGAVSGGGAEKIGSMQGGRIFVRLPTEERKFVCVEEGTGEVVVTTEVDWKLAAVEGYGPWDLRATVGTKTAVICNGTQGKKTLALTYKDHRIPFQEIYLAEPDACPDPHWHAIGATVITVAGQEMADPNRNECGFGRVLGANWELVSMTNRPVE